MAPSDDNTGGNGAEPPVASPRKSPLGGMNFSMPKGLSPTVAVVAAAMLALAFGGGYVAATTGIFTGGKGGPEGSVATVEKSGRSPGALAWIKAANSCSGKPACAHCWGVMPVSKQDSGSGS